MTETAHDIRLKRLRFQSWHRGFREMDLILGAFADDRLAGLSAEDLTLYQSLLDVPDWDIYGWLTQTKPVPPEWDNALLHLILDHVRQRPRP